MAERPIEATQVLECRYPRYACGEYYLYTWTKSLRAEGGTETQALERLNQKIDRYYKKLDENLPPTPFYYEMFGCRRIGEPAKERKLTLWDSCRRLFTLLHTRCPQTETKDNNEETFVK